jgi:hypothetical protein
MNLEGPYTKQDSSVFKTLSFCLQTDNGKQVFSHQIEKIWAGSLSSFTGYRFPGYKAAIKNGMPATTPASATRYHINFPTGEAHWRTANKQSLDQYATSVYGDCYGINIPSAFVSAQGTSNPTQENRALSLFWARAYDVISPVQGGIIFAEMHKTLHDIRNPIEGITHFLLDYHKRVLSSVKKLKTRDRSSLVARNLRDAIQKQWLQTNYGLIPTMQDLDSVMERLSSYAPELTNSRFPISATGKSDTIVVASGSGPNAIDPVLGSSPTLHFNYIVTQDYVCRYKGVVDVGIASGRRFATSWGIDPLTNFIPTVYELIPYSFLLDYVSNVGKVIQSYMVPSANVIWYNKTRRTVRKGTETALYFTYGVDGDWIPRISKLPDQRFSYAVSFDRSGNFSGQQLPRPNVDFSEFNRTLKSVRRLGNVIALLGQNVL